VSYGEQMDIERKIIFMENMFCIYGEPCYSDPVSLLTAIFGNDDWNGDEWTVYVRCFFYKGPLSTAPERLLNLGDCDCLLKRLKVK